MWKLMFEYLTDSNTLLDNYNKKLWKHTNKQEKKVSYIQKVE